MPEEKQPVANNDLYLPVNLSKRQMEVLQKICDGRSTAEIAEELFISVNTVKYHIKGLFTALQVSNRAMLVRRAVQREWVK